MAFIIAGSLRRRGTLLEARAGPKLGAPSEKWAICRQDANLDTPHADDDASAPLQREAWEIDAASIFPGIPFH